MFKIFLSLNNKEKSIYKHKNQFLGLNIGILLLNHILATVKLYLFMVLGFINIFFIFFLNYFYLQVFKYVLKLFSVIYRQTPFLFL